MEVSLKICTFSSVFSFFPVFEKVSAGTQTLVAVFCESLIKFMQLSLRRTSGTKSMYSKGATD